MASNMSLQSKVVIRPAELNDCKEILRLILELAAYEEMADQVKMTVEMLQRDCFGDKPLCSCAVATKEEDKDTLIGYVMYYPTYSAWFGPSINMEELYVSPSFRNQGVGKLLWLKVAEAGLAQGCTRLYMVVLGWNRNAMDLYKRHGCEDITETEDWRFVKQDEKGMIEFVRHMKQQPCH